MTLSRNLVCKRLRSCGFKPEIVHRVLDQLSYWIKRNGEEWTVSRLKELKRSFVAQYAGTPGDYPAWWKHHKGIPKGQFRHLFSMDTPKLVRRSINALMIYTAYTRKGDPTKQQYAKWSDGVKTRRHPSPTVIDVLATDAKHLKPDMSMYTVQELFQRNFSKVTFDHSARWFHRNKAMCFCKGQVETSHTLHRRAEEALVYAKDEELELISRCKPRYYHDNELLPVIGSIGFIQEPGYKLRAVANVHPAWQVLCSKISKAAWKTCERLPGVYLNQVEGLQSLANHQKLCSYFDSSEKKFYSFDLSSATDIFPWELTKRMLSELLVKPNGAPAHMTPFEGEQWKHQWDIVEEISRGIYLQKSTGKDNPIPIRWVSGQPMGAYFSFPLFTLSHYLLALKAKQVEPDAEFWLLGDDIVFHSDGTAALRYQALMESLDVKINMSKSLPKSNVAEFCGKILINGHIIHQPKCKEMVKHQIHTYAINLGQGILDIVPKSVRRKLILAGHLLRPDFPQWNHLKIRYDIREEMTEIVAEHLDRPKRHLNRSDWRNLAEDLRVNSETVPEHLAAKQPVEPISGTTVLADVTRFIEVEKPDGTVERIKVSTMVIGDQASEKPVIESPTDEIGYPPIQPTIVDSKPTNLVNEVSKAIENAVQPEAKPKASDILSQIFVKHMQQWYPDYGKPQPVGNDQSGSLVKEMTNTDGTVLSTTTSHEDEKVKSSGSRIKKR